MTYEGSFGYQDQVRISEQQFLETYTADPARWPSLSGTLYGAGR